MSPGSKPATFTMTQSAAFQITNKLSELGPLMDRISAWCRSQSLSEGTIYEVNLIVDELVSNVIRHGSRDGQEYTIAFRISIVGDALEMVLEDGGLAFNPLLAPVPDLSRPIEERKPGGLGVFMVK